MNRREFLKASAFAGVVAAVSPQFLQFTAAGLLSSPATDLASEAERWVVTSCLHCPAACPLRVRVINGRAVQILGNSLSPTTQGQICVRAHLALQALYAPNRVAAPMKRINRLPGVKPQWAAISWERALAEVATGLKGLQDGGKPHQLLILAGLVSSGEQAILARLAQALGTPNLVFEGSFSHTGDVAGRWLADGHGELPVYDLARSRYVLAFGANILESERPLSRLQRMWGYMRRERPDRGKVVVIDPRYSVTACKADEWLPINPGTDAALALGLAHVLISEDLYDRPFVERWADGFEHYQALVLRDYEPERVAGITGISAATITRIAREFGATRPGMAWAGTGATSWPHGAYAGYAIFCLNALVGSIDVPGGVLYQEHPSYRPLPSLELSQEAQRGLQQPPLVDEELPGLGPNALRLLEALVAQEPYQVGVALLVRSNPLAQLPAPHRWREALERVPFVIQATSHWDEVSPYANLVLPLSTFLESWSYDEASPGSGVAEVRLRQPVVEPMNDSRCLIDLVLALAQTMGGPVGAAFADCRAAPNLVRYRTEPLVSWSEFLERGIWVGPTYHYSKYQKIFHTPSGKFEFYSHNLERLLEKSSKATKMVTGPLRLLPHYEAPTFLGAKEEYPLSLAPYCPALLVEDGTANQPWAQQNYLPILGVGWENPVEMNRKTGEALGLKDGYLVWVQSPYSKLQARVRLIEGIHPGVVAMALGQGRSDPLGRSKVVGANPLILLGLGYDEAGGQAALFNTRVRVYRA